MAGLDQRANRTAFCGAISESWGTKAQPLLEPASQQVSPQFRAREETACLTPRPGTPRQSLCIPKPGQSLQTTMAQAPAPPRLVVSHRRRGSTTRRRAELDNKVPRSGSQAGGQFPEGTMPGRPAVAPVGLPYWPELMAISMMESLMCVAGSPCESTSSGGPGREMSSRAETLGGESRVLEGSEEGSGVESPLWTGALDSSDKERTGGFCGDRYC